MAPSWPTSQVKRAGCAACNLRLRPQSTTAPFPKVALGEPNARTMSDFINSKTVNGLTVKLWRVSGWSLSAWTWTLPNPILSASRSRSRLRQAIRFSRYAIGSISPTTSRQPWLSTDTGISCPPKRHSRSFAGFSSHSTLSPASTPIGSPRSTCGPTAHWVGRTSVITDLTLDIVIYDGFLSARALPEGFASSQAYVDRYKGNTKVNPGLTPTGGLDFKKVPGDVYDWLGFEASQLIFDFLKDVAGDEVSGARFSSRTT